jgi:hypothetical protein
MSVEEWEVLNGRADFHWFCQQCNGSYFPKQEGMMVIRNVDRKLHKKIDVLNKQLKEEKETRSNDGTDLAEIKRHLLLLEAKVNEKFEEIANKVPSKLQEKLVFTHLGPIGKI